MEDLEIECKKSEIEIITRQSFLNDPGDAVKNLKRQDARIVVGLFYVSAARRVLCEIYKNDLYGRGHVWFFIGKLKFIDTKLHEFIYSAYIIIYLQLLVVWMDKTNNHDAREFINFY